MTYLLQDAAGCAETRRYARWFADRPEAMWLLRKAHNERMTTMARFNRNRLIEQLERQAQEVQRRNSFDHKNGTAQLHPLRCNAEMDALIDRAVAYGRWRAMQDIAADLENGTAGT